MVKISTVIITKDAEDLIADAIDSVKFTDEIIVVDSGSSDRTVELSKKLGAKVYEIKSSDFSQLRDLGLDKATGDWVLYIDSDERVSSELREEIKKTLESTEYSSYNLQRVNYYLGEYQWPKVEKMPRLFKRDSFKGWTGKLHETPNFEGQIGLLQGYLRHYTHRDLASMTDKTINWSDTEAQVRFDNKHPKITWWRFPRVMIPTFFRYYIKEGGYKLGTAGLVESMFQAFSIFVTYAKLWEKQENS